MSSISRCLYIIVETIRLKYISYKRRQYHVITIIQFMEIKIDINYIENSTLVITIKNRTVVLFKIRSESFQRKEGADDLLNRTNR